MFTGHAFFASSVIHKNIFVVALIIVCDFVEKISNDNLVRINSPCIKRGKRKVIENQISILSLHLNVWS